MKTVILALLCACFLLGSSKLKAQDPTYSSDVPSHNFQYQPSQISDFVENPRYQLNLEWLSANGYGQWMSNINSGIVEWHLGSDNLLLSNEGTNPAWNNSGPIQPPGLIDFSTTYSSTVDYNDLLEDDSRIGITKVTSNLDGSTRWVSVGADQRSFIIQGVNDNVAKYGTSGTVNIDVGAYKQLPYPSTSRDLFIQGAGAIAIQYPTLSAGSFDIATPGLEDAADCFDIAMDKNYLYIIWESSQFEDLNFPNYPPNVQRVNRIFFQVVDLVTGLPVGSLNTTNLNNVNGVRPTVSCDPRNSNGIKCDIAYITQVPNGQVVYHRVSGGVVQAASPLQTQYGFTKTQNPLSLTSYASPTHARVVTGSVDLWNTANQLPVKGIYVIADHNLLLYRIESATDIPYPPFALYVDGLNSAYQTGRHSPVLDRTVENVFYGVVDDPIKAFSDPYNGQKTIAYDDFHCLYRLEPIREGNVIAPPEFLMIVKEFQSSTRGAINRYSTNSGTTWLALAPPSNTNFFGAINQKGISIYWHSTSSQFYSRALHEIDEDIEENTLITYENRVRGVSDKNFEVKLKPGKSLVLWTDPNFLASEASLVSNGLYIAPSGRPAGWNNAQLKILGSDTKLIIGNGSLPSNLITLPNFELSFSDASQQLVIKGLSEFHYNGVPVGVGIGGLGTNISGPGTVKLDGTGVTLSGGTTGYPTTITTPAKLIVYGNANFFLPSETKFQSTGGLIDLKYGLDVSDPRSAPPGNATGRMTLKGIADITSSIVRGAANSNTLIAISVQPCDNCNSRTWQFTASNTLFENTNTGGSYKIEFTSDPNKTYKDVKFNYDRLNRVSIDAQEAGVRLSGESPFRAFRVMNSEFANVSDNAVKIDYNTVYDRLYDIISVDNNVFSSFAVPNKCGVLVTDYHYANRRIAVSVEDNDFTANTGLTGTDKVEAAIKFDATSGELTSNTISGSGYANGIINTESSFFGNLTNTLFCFNDISNCSNGTNGVGIWTNYWEGYVKSNTVSNCDIGFLSDDHDHGHIIYSTITGSTNEGLRVRNFMDLSGVPPIGSEAGYAAYNTIADNNENIDGSLGQIAIDEGWFLVLSGGATSDNDGKNNIRTTSTNTGDLFIYSPNNYTASLTDLHDVSTQYWSDPNGTHTLPTLSSSEVRMFGVQYDSNPLSGTSTFSADPPFCSSGILGIASSSSKESGGLNNTESIETLEDAGDSSYCTKLFKKGMDAETVGQKRIAYDTLRFYVEHCYDEKESYRAFMELTGAASGLEEENHALEYEFRQWLLSVLYLNTTEPRYYCQAADALLSTFTYVPNRGLDFNGVLSVVKYLAESNKCPEYNERWTKYWNGTRAKQYENWRDTVTVDTMLYKMDTTLPSLEELGLGILRQNPNAGVKPAHFPEVTLGEITASNNPFREETYITLEMQKLGLVKFELLNELGQVVQQNGIGRVIEKGRHRIPIDGSNLASGTYYARFSSSDGQTRTLKLKHIK